MLSGIRAAIAAAFVVLCLVAYRRTIDRQMLGAAAIAAAGLVLAEGTLFFAGEVTGSPSFVRVAHLIGILVHLGFSACALVLVFRHRYDEVRRHPN
jgi:hypothetical protein